MRSVLRLLRMAAFLTASRSPSLAHSPTMASSKDPAHAYLTVETSQSTKDGKTTTSKTATCDFCGLKASFGEVARWRKHLSGDPDLCMSNHGIGPCPAVTDRIAEKFTKLQKDKDDAKMAAAKVARDREDNERAHSSSSGAASKKQKANGAMDRHLNNFAVADATAAVAAFFHGESTVPANIANTKLFKAMLKKVQGAPPGWKAPDRHAIYGTLLDDAGQPEAARAVRGADAAAWERAAGPSGGREVRQAAETASILATDLRTLGQGVAGGESAAMAACDECVVCRAVADARLSRIADAVRNGAWRSTAVALALGQSPSVSFGRAPGASPWVERVMGALGDLQDVAWAEKGDPLYLQKFDKAAELVRTAAVPAPSLAEARAVSAWLARVGMRRFAWPSESEATAPVALERWLSRGPGADADEHAKWATRCWGAILALYWPTSAEIAARRLRAASGRSRGGGGSGHAPPRQVVPVAPCVGSAGGENVHRARSSPARGQPAAVRGGGAAAERARLGEAARRRRRQGRRSLAGGGCGVSGAGRGADRPVAGRGSAPAHPGGRGRGERLRARARRQRHGRRQRPSDGALPGGGERRLRGESVALGPRLRGLGGPAVVAPRERDAGHAGHRARRRQPGGGRAAACPDGLPRDALLHHEGARFPPSRRRTAPPAVYWVPIATVSWY